MQNPSNAFSVNSFVHRLQTTIGLSHAVQASILALVLSSAVAASDHADPIDATRLKPLEPVITDLFVFPVDAKGKVVAPFEVTDGIPLHPLRGPSGLPMRPELTYEQRKSIKSLVVILCVRRMLTQTNSLNLEPYQYRIHMDTATTVSFDNTAADEMAREAMKAEAGMGYRPADAPKVDRPTGEEARARYGGTIGRPDKIDDDVIIELTLKNDASLNTFLPKQGLTAEKFDRSGVWNPEVISVWTGVRDDPFIFPAFFGTNVVAMVVSIPMHYFKSGNQDWLVWATSHKNKSQIDHVGRSLRTQNPRFELLNTLHPRDHVAAIEEEIKDPSLVRDIEVRLNLLQLAAYRDWDRVPDVMIYTTRFPVGFPNGRLLTDDVAALLAQHGDTLLLELSHNNAQWPRRTTNDKVFSSDFPYLPEPWPDKPTPEPYSLSTKNTLILLGIALAILAILVLALLQVIHIIRKILGIRSRPRPV
jgi:hypothetical protein